MGGCKKKLSILGLSGAAWASRSSTGVLRPPQRMWQVAIPSYRRAALLRDQTLALLKKHGVPRERITVFVANEEEHRE